MVHLCLALSLDYFSAFPLQMQFKRYARMWKIWQFGAASKLSYFAGEMAVGSFILQPCLYSYIWYVPLTLGQLSQCCTKDDQPLWQYQNQPPKYVTLRFAFKILPRGDNRKVYKILSNKANGHIWLELCICHVNSRAHAYILDNPFSIQSQWQLHKCKLSKFDSTDSI